MDAQPNPRASLNELLGDALDLDVMPEPVAEAWPHLGRKAPAKLSLAELFFLVRHDVALPHAAPEAISRLRGEPFVQAEEYPGDLLVALMEADSRYWLGQLETWYDMVDVLSEAVAAINAHLAGQEEGEEAYLPFHLGDNFMGALTHFRGLHGGAPGDEPGA